MVRFFLHWQAVNVKLRQRTTLIGWTCSLNFTLTASSCKPNSASQLIDFYTEVEVGQARDDHSLGLDNLGLFPKISTYLKAKFAMNEHCKAMKTRKKIPQICFLFHNFQIRVAIFMKSHFYPCLLYTSPSPRD